MSLRPDIAQIVTRLNAVVPPLVAGVYISTLFDNQFANKFGRVWPAIWVGGIRIIPRTAADGLTEIARQNSNVEVAFRLLVQRNPAGSLDDLEARVIALSDALDKAMFGWQPTWARNRFGLARYVDGPASEPSCSVDVYYAAQYARTYP